MIEIRSEKIFEIYGFPITNTLLTSWLTFVLLSLIIFILKKSLKNRPFKLQALAEILLENTYNFLHSIFGENFNLKIFSFILTFFLFILFSNWLGILPIVGSIYIQEGEQKVPIFRSTYSDLNMTLALALISVIGTNLLGILNFGIKFIKRYTNPIGILELFGEFAKILSFSFRLFGNIFAGEVLLTIIAGLFVLFAPIPFLGLELFVGLIQALIFAVLTTIFLKVAISEH
ncbi:MAG: F0F1 ATP synthase subunit A [Candidatus Methanomethyliaceae archaeon]